MSSKPSRRFGVFPSANEDAKAAQQATEALQGEAAAVSKKQGRVQDLMRRLAEKLGKENETEGGR